MSSPYRAYLRQVERELRCARLEKARLLRMLEIEMAEGASDPAVLSADELVQRFGPPETAAGQLQEALPPEAVKRHTSRRQRRFAATIAACVCVIALLAGYLVWLGSIDVDVTYTKEIIDAGYHN